MFIANGIASEAALVVALEPGAKGARLTVELERLDTKAVSGATERRHHATETFYLDAAAFAALADECHGADLVVGRTFPVSRLFAAGTKSVNAPSL